MIVLDVESSGLDPERASILSLGALDLDDPTNQFYDECGVWEGADINDDAIAVGGFSREEITNGQKKSEAELIRDFVAWATDKPENRMLVAQNVRFDLSFVEDACKRAGIESPFAHRVLDVHSLCWAHMTLHGLTPPVKNHRSDINLTYVLEYCGLPKEPDPHNALTGAFCHAEAVSRMAYNRKLLPDFSSFEIPWLKNPS